jgi:hypothetical protein
VTNCDSCAAALIRFSETALAAERSIFLFADNLMLRGTTLKNTSYILGINIIQRSGDIYWI